MSKICYSFQQQQKDKNYKVNYNKNSFLMKVKYFSFFLHYIYNIHNIDPLYIVAINVTKMYQFQELYYTYIVYLYIVV